MAQHIGVAPLTVAYRVDGSPCYVYEGEAFGVDDLREGEVERLTEVGAIRPLLEEPPAKPRTKAAAKTDPVKADPTPPVSTPAATA